MAASNVYVIDSCRSLFKRRPAGVIRPVGAREDGGLDDTAQRVAVDAGARQDWFNVDVSQRGVGGIVPLLHKAVDRHVV